MNPIQKIINELRKAVQGKDQVLVWILMTILADGNILLEDIPGVGKTNMALAFSRALGLDYGRVQFNPDVLPSDITGYSVYHKQTGSMVYQKGAILCNLFLADELNRATSRTQSALLEAMEEGQVTVDGVTHKLPRPFTVIATQNPTGAAGTQLLPDSQMDRFTVRLSVGYPKAVDEREMVLARMGGVNPLTTVQQVVSREELVAMQTAVSQIYMKDALVDYIVNLIAATRQHAQIVRGASPRATLAVVSMAKASAYMNGRDYALPDDVRTVFVGTVAHRLLLNADAQGAGLSESKILSDLLDRIPSPGV
ncbi:MAG: MoxR family ATPase [Oscillospiraceae bacterium]|jgi:MoxR-like ATPase|nr:MoxR family ATPase [Oscillospiraceae bacterium]